MVGVASAGASCIRPKTPSTKATILGVGQVVKINSSVSLEREMWLKLDDMAKEAGISRNHFIGELVELGLRSLEKGDRLGKGST